MFDVSGKGKRSWNAVLTPKGFDTAGREPFDEWWARNERYLTNLHPQIAEQWIYRHWATSRYRFIPLEPLSWRTVSWSTAEVLERVHVVGERDPAPEFDYTVFHRSGGNTHPTARTWSNGTWNIPLLVLNTADGILSIDGPMPDVRYVLIEGHLRMRYLGALRWRGEPTGPHELFVLSAPRDLKPNMGLK